MNVSSTVLEIKNWELENGKKMGFWRSKKYLKLVILEKKKVQWQTVSIM